MREAIVPRYFQSRQMALLAVFIGSTSSILVHIVPGQYLLAMLFTVAGTFFLFRFPEVALSLFLVIGTFKGDPIMRGFFGRFDPTIYLAAIVWTAMGFRLWKQDRFPVKTSFFIPLTFLVVLTVVSLTYTPNISVGIDKAGRFLILTLMGMISPIFFLRDREAFRRFLISLSILSFVVSLRLMAGWSANWTRQVKVAGTNYLALGRITGIGAILGTYYFLTADSITKRWSALTFTVFSVGVLFLSGGRGPTVFLLATFLLVLGLASFSSQISTSFRSLLIRVLASISLTALFAWFFLPSAFQRRLLLFLGLWPGSGTFGASETLRLTLFESAASIIMQNPVLGVGFGGSLDALIFYPHNIFLEIGAEMGLLGLAIFSLILFLTFRSLLKEVFISYSNSFDKSTIILSLMLLTYASLGALVSGDVNDNKFLWFSIGLAYATVALFGGRPKTPSAIRNE